MKTRPDLNELSKQVFEGNKKRGFHEVEHSNEHLLMLVITELSEAVEADRKDRRANVKLYYSALENHISKTHKEIFEDCIKDSIEDELADAVIRLLDLAGCRGYEITPFFWHPPTMKDNMTFTELTYDIVNSIYIKNKMSSKVFGMIKKIEVLSKMYDIDLWQHVELKLKYNETREYKHGKNLLV